MHSPQLFSFGTRISSGLQAQQQQREEREQREEKIRRDAEMAFVSFSLKFNTTCPRCLTISPSPSMQLVDIGGRSFSYFPTPQPPRALSVTMEGAHAEGGEASVPAPSGPLALSGEKVKIALPPSHPQGARVWLNHLPHLSPMVVEGGAHPPRPSPLNLARLMGLSSTTATAGGEQGHTEEQQESVQSHEDSAAGMSARYARYPPLSILSLDRKEPGAVVFDDELEDEDRGAVDGTERAGRAQSPFSFPPLSPPRAHSPFFKQEDSETASSAGGSDLWGGQALPPSLERFAKTLSEEVQALIQSVVSRGAHPHPQPLVSNHAPFLTPTPIPVVPPKRKYISPRNYYNPPPDWADRILKMWRDEEREERELGLRQFSDVKDTEDFSQLYALTRGKRRGGGAQQLPSRRRTQSVETEVTDEGMQSPGSPGSPDSPGGLSGGEGVETERRTSRTSRTSRTNGNGAAVGLTTAALSSLLAVQHAEGGVGVPPATPPTRPRPSASFLSPRTRRHL